MSLLGDSSPEPTTNNSSVVDVHCNNCGTDYYVQIPSGETVASVVAGMKCNCDNSQLVVVNPTTDETTSEIVS